MQQIVNDLKKKNYEVLKVEEDVLYKTRQRKLAALVKEYE